MHKVAVQRHREHITIMYIVYTTIENVQWGRTSA